MPSRRRAIGIVRVSQVAGREGESFASPTTQRERITAECERQELDLLAVHEELDISGSADLDQRPGLGPAVEAIERGEAEVIVAAYFDRFFRSLDVQSRVLERVERAGGEVLAVDSGRVSHSTAAQWLSASQSGMMAEYFRRMTGERTAEAIQRAIDRGVPPWPRVTAGYRKRPDGRYEPSTHATAVREAFEQRARGATFREVREHLRVRGVRLGYPGVVKLLASRVVLGEIHFGAFKPNLAAHDPIVDRDLWGAVQRIRVPSGRATKSPRLLARLKVLRCGMCGSPLAANTADGGRYQIYRCQNADCSRRVAVSGPLADDTVTEAVRAGLAGLQGRADVGHDVEVAEAAVDRARAAFEAAVRAFSGFGEEESVVRDRLLELQGERRQAEDHLERLRGQRAAVVVNAAADWDRLTLAERRALIRVTVERADVAPGRGPGRIAVRLFGE